MHSVDRELQYTVTRDTQPETGWMYLYAGTKRKVV